MTQRLTDWGDLWHIRQDNQPEPRTSLREQAKQRAQQLEPRAFGQDPQGSSKQSERPDAVSAQLLRTAPPCHLALCLNSSRKWSKPHSFTPAHGSYATQEPDHRETPHLDLHTIPDHMNHDRRDQGQMFYKLHWRDCYDKKCTEPTTNMVSLSSWTRQPFTTPSNLRDYKNRP